MDRRQNGITRKCQLQGVVSISRAKTDLFQINGKPILVSDGQVGFSYSDLESSDSGTDESGYYHRIVVKHQKASFTFEYAFLTDEDYRYMESLFPEEPDFLFTHPSRLDPTVAVTSRCFRKNVGINWKNAKTGDWRNYKFTISEC